MLGKWIFDGIRPDRADQPLNRVLDGVNAPPSVSTTPDSLHRTFAG
jgi:hypothetical protein